MSMLAIEFWLVDIDNLAFWVVYESAGPNTLLNLESK